VQAKLAKGVREGKPGNVIWILKWVGECPPTYVLPARIAEYRYANGKHPGRAPRGPYRAFRTP
jgi:hypothetical protein